MRWPWQPRETREAAGGYTSIISALIRAQAAGTTQQASATAATEAVAGALSRAFADARVDGPADVAEALPPPALWRELAVTWCASANPCTSFG